MIIHEPEFFNYICDKRRWTKDDYDAVLWRSNKSALDKFNRSTKTNVLQLVHNWQNTGSQKQKFFDSSMRGKDSSLREASEKYSKKHFVCPLCRIHMETPLHFVQCPKLISAQGAIDLRNELLKKLCTLNTYDALIDLIFSILKGLPPEDITFTVGHTFTNLWKQAFDGQQRIGWRSFIQGFWHYSWKEV